MGQKVGSWQSLGMDVVLIVGGPNGLTDEIRQKPMRCGLYLN